MSCCRPSSRTALAERRGEPQDRVFAITERRINYIVKAAAKRAYQSCESAHWLRHAHASHAIDGGAPITLVRRRPSGTPT